MKSMEIQKETIQTIEKSLILEMQKGKSREEALLIMLQRASQAVVNLREELWESEQC